MKTNLEVALKLIEEVRSELIAVDGFKNEVEALFTVSFLLKRESELNPEPAINEEKLVSLIDKHFQAKIEKVLTESDIRDLIEMEIEDKIAQVIDEKDFISKDDIETYFENACENIDLDDFSDFRSLVEKVEELEEKVDSIESRTDDLENDLEDQKTEIVSLEEKVDELKPEEIAEKTISIIKSKL